jgi:serine/threonine-protein kinase
MISVAESETPAIEIGKYRVVAELAKGGMGNVYLAIAQGPGRFNKLLAVKELKPSFCEDETYVAMFLEEARLAARLTHPNIVQTNEVGSDGNRHFMIMEFLDGRTLQRIGRHLARHDGLSVGGHLRVITEALRGLHYAHELRGFDGESLDIVHRDVSPLNVVVTFDGQAKVLDFGIAKSVDSALVTRTGILKGRIAYMSPEQASGGKVDRRADIYSAGVMVWEAAAGRRLWPQMTEVEILSRVLSEGPPSLRAVCPHASLELDAICARATARHPHDRYPTAAEFVDALESYLAQRDDAMSMREIGLIVGRAFQAERDKMSLIIEETVSRFPNGPRSGHMPRLPSPVSGTQAVSPVTGGLGDGPVSGSRSAPSLWVEGSIMAPDPGDANDDGAIEAPPSRSLVSWLAGAVAARGVAVVLAVALAVAVAYRVGKSSPAATQGTVPTVAAAVASPAPEPVFIHLAVQASPTTAQITLDGEPVPSNPSRMQRAKDDQLHTLVVSADDYETKSEQVSFSGDTVIDIRLDRRASAPLPAVVTHRSPQRVAPPPAKAHPAPDPPSPPPPRSRPQPTVAAQTGVGSAGGRAPLRPIEANNPYESR